MIGYLQGTVLAKDPERVLLDVHGVGYEVYIPVSTYYEIDRVEDGVPVALHIHTHLRDDGLTLFGFWTDAERVLFERLIAVSGIGPRLARVVLSGLAPAELVAAISAGDLARLSGIPGIGKKTAERMILELRDKVGDVVPAAAAARTVGPGDDDLVSALVNLGYKRAKAERAVIEARREAPGADFSELLRASLRRLSRA